MRADTAPGRGRARRRARTSAPPPVDPWAARALRTGAAASSYCAAGAPAATASRRLGEIPAGIAARSSAGEGAACGGRIGRFRLGGQLRDRTGRRAVDRRVDRLCGVGKRGRLERRGLDFRGFGRLPVQFRPLQKRRPHPYLARCDCRRDRERDAEQHGALMTGVERPGVLNAARGQRRRLRRRRP